MIKKHCIKSCFTFLLLFSFFFAPKAKAQWVTIPDANFVAFLQQNFPSCMNGNLMDTTCSDLLATTRLICDSRAIYNLDGVQYFKGLDTLDCNRNHLTSLPVLPNSLIFLNCYDNELIILPSLPSFLLFLNCSKNELDDLPSLPSSLISLYSADLNLTNLPSLPNSLSILNCSYNQLTSLPQLPTSLTYLYCQMNSLISLPSLPPLLTYFDCSYNQITNLPILPTFLNTLNCSNNDLTNLPVLPPLMNDFIDCASNQLTELPAMPNSLTWLSCSYNQLTYLPPLPTSLVGLDCYNNSLTNLPFLPDSLTWLHCYDNEISCFPALPVALIYTNYFNISNNPYTCLPNYVPAMNGTPYLSYPLCMNGDLVNNPNLCSGAKGVIGNVYYDVNSDCSYDVSDSAINNIAVQLQDSSGILLTTFYSLSNGVYNFYLDSGTYTVSIDTVNKPYAANCIVDSTFTLDSITPLLQHGDFAIGCKPGFDLGVQSVYRNGIAFSGLSHRVYVDSGDLLQWYSLYCANGISGTVQINVTGPLTYDSVANGMLTPDVISGNNFTYNIADFGTLPLHSIGFWFTSDTTAQIGDQICVTVDITPTVGDNDTTNNHKVFCYPVTNSIDPNEKEVSPVGSVPPGYQDYFTYTLHFQNTGTAAAQNIRLVDTVDTNLDISTFEISGFSHANTTTLRGRVLTVRFPNIQLPDSTANADASKGWFQYRIKPIANLPLGAQVQNKAYIYFDFNAPIVTNTTVSNFNNTTGVMQTSNANEFVSINPNPSTGMFALHFNTSTSRTVDVFTIEGKNILHNTIQNTNAALDLHNQPAGIYLLRVVSDKSILNARLVVER